MKKTIALFIIIFSAFAFTQAQDTSQVRQYINDLSSKEMHGRGYAYNGDGIAAKYISEQFMKMGLETFYLPYDFDVYAMEGPVSVKLDGRELTPWQDYALAPYSHSANGTFNIINISTTTFCSDKDFKKFCNKNKESLQNALLYIDLTSCKNDDEQKQVNRKLSLLSDINGLPFKGLIVGTKNIPVWSFNYAKKPCDYILTYVKIGLIDKNVHQISLTYKNEIRNHQTQDVVGVLPGTEVPDSVIIIGGHYDHLGQMGDAVLFPGAHDNASGTATVLDMAQYFKENPLRYTIYFVLFSGEEAGLMGSFAFVDNPPIDLSKVKFMLNLDLLCGGEDGFTVVNSDGPGADKFFQSITALNEKYHFVTAVKPRKNAANSDHYPFVAKGVPAVFIYVMGGKTGGYHQPDDTSENATLNAYPGIFTLLVKGLGSIR